MLTVRKKKMSWKILPTLRWRSLSIFIVVPKKRIHGEDKRSRNCPYLDTINRYIDLHTQLLDLLYIHGKKIVCVVTDRIRRMGEGNVFSLYTPGGGGYPGQVQTGVYRPWHGGTYPCQVQTGGGGVPTLVSPPPPARVGTPSPGMPLAFTWGEFLVSYFIAHVQLFYFCGFFSDLYWILILKNYALYLCPI